LGVSKRCEVIIVTLLSVIGLIVAVKARANTGGGA